MGYGSWFKTLICLKRIKGNKYKQVGATGQGSSRKTSRLKQLTENDSATIIQSAFRAYMARNALRRLRGIVRFRGVIEQGRHHLVKNQASSALNQIHLWSRIQAEIKARWLGTVSDGRTRQKKLENSFRVESKLHELEEEWVGGPETMEDILNRIQQREEAAAKRERAMAYAFSHQWRANSSHYFGQAYYDIGKESWGWSWKDRWIAARPWEHRVQAKPVHTMKLETKQKTTEVPNSTSMKATASVKPLLSNAQLTTIVRNLSKVSQDAA